MASPGRSYPNYSELNPIFGAFLNNTSRRFDFLKIGPLCNGSRCFSFSEAFCDLVPRCHVRLSDCPLSVYFHVLFDRAYELIGAQTSEENVALSTEEEKAFRDLQKFFWNIETHSKNISNAFEMVKKEASKEAILSMALAEHLISPLASGYVCNIDSRLQGKGENKTSNYGYNKPTHFGATGIGHHKVWHGFADIIIKERRANTDLAAGLVTVFTDQNIQEDERNVTGVLYPGDIMEPSPAKRQKFQDDDSQDLRSAGEETFSDVKLNRNRHIEDRTVAQTIVFALALKQHYTDTNEFVPNILICDEKIFIVMYDPVKDILIWSGEYPIWDKLSPTSLNTVTIITLWMVIHYKLFCAGGEIFENINEVKAGFFDRITEDKKEFYERLLLGVKKFETDSKELGFRFRSHEVSDSFVLAKVNL